MKRTHLQLALALGVALLAAGCARRRCCPSSPGAGTWSPIAPVAPAGPGAGTTTPLALEAVSAPEAARRLHGRTFVSMSCTAAGCVSTLEALAQSAGVNLVVSDAARRQAAGDISLDLQGVTLAQALDAVTAAQGLTWHEEGPGLIVIDVKDGAGAPAVAPGEGAAPDEAPEGLHGADHDGEDDEGADDDGEDDDDPGDDDDEDDDDERR